MLNLLRIAVGYGKPLWRATAVTAVYSPIEVLALGLDIVETIAAFTLAFAPASLLLSSTHGEKFGRGYWRQR